MLWKFAMKHQGMELYKVYVNHEPEDDLYLFYGKVNIGPPCI